MRLVPLFPFNLTNYALGLTRIRFVPYVMTSFICMAPGAIAYTWLGYAGREALAGDTSAIRYGLLALGLLAAIAFLPRLVKPVGSKQTSWQPDLAVAAPPSSTSARPTNSPIPSVILRRR